MTTSKKPTKTSWIDPDDAPDLATPEWRAKFASADLRQGNKIVRRGRPPLAHPKQPVNLRLDRDIVEQFKAGGPGWQTRINDQLRASFKKAAPMHSPKAASLRKKAAPEPRGKRFAAKRRQP
jgi:uncharacterized protein (DUF4415 family)